jgi:hypothetical protein
MQHSFIGLPYNDLNFQMNCPIKACKFVLLNNLVQNFASTQQGLFLLNYYV